MKIMAVQSKLSIFCSSVKYIIALFLLVVSIILSKDVLDQYTAKATSYKQKEQDVTENESITLSFQFWPLKRTDYPSSVLYQSYEQWKLGTDFTLAFGILNYRSAEEVLNLDENTKDFNISHSSIGHVRFDKLVT